MSTSQEQNETIDTVFPFVEIGPERTRCNRTTTSLLKCIVTPNYKPGSINNSISISPDKPKTSSKNETSAWGQSWTIKYKTPLGQIEPLVFSFSHGFGEDVYELNSYGLSELKLMTKDDPNNKVIKNKTDYSFGLPLYGLNGNNDMQIALTNFLDDVRTAVIVDAVRNSKNIHKLNIPRAKNESDIVAAWKTGFPHIYRPTKIKDMAGIPTNQSDFDKLNIYFKVTIYNNNLINMADSIDALDSNLTPEKRKEKIDEIIIANIGTSFYDVKTTQVSSTGVIIPKPVPVVTLSFDDNGKVVRSPDKTIPFALNINGPIEIAHIEVALKYWFGTICAFQVKPDKVYFRKTNVKRDTFSEDFEPIKSNNNNNGEQFASLDKFNF